MTPNIVMYVWVGSGAALGACLRYALNVYLNPLGTGLGTWVANMLGALLMGMMLAVVAVWPSWSPELRTAVMVGFLGGLTTFSAFSAEMLALLQAARYGGLVWHIVGHVLGSLVCIGAGYRVTLWIVMTMVARRV